MNIKEVLLDFGIIFVVSMIVTAIVTFLYSLIVHGTGIIDWETSFNFAIIFGIVLTWTRSRKD